MCMIDTAVAPMCGPPENGKDGSWAFIDGEWVFTEAEPRMGEGEDDDDAGSSTQAGGDDASSGDSGSANILKFFATVLIALIALL